MTILLFGKDGQVGWELQRSLSPLGPVVALGRGDVDLTRAGDVREIAEKYRPAVIVNAAAYTAVDRAEAEPELAHAVNCEAVAAMAAAAASTGGCLVHYSTDYVFDGSKLGRYAEADPTNPLNVYGRTKLAGEDATRASGCAHLIFRTSWVYAMRGANFPATMLRLAKERDELRVVADQTGAPTSAELIADVTALILFRHLAEPNLLKAASGTYNLCADGETSWHGYACHLFERAQALGIALRARPENVRAVLSSEYPTAAARPLNSRLSIDKLADTFAIRTPDWRHHLDRWLRRAAETR